MNQQNVVDYLLTGLACVTEELISIPEHYRVITREFENNIVPLLSNHVNMLLL